MQTNAIDVSEYQGDIDWSAVQEPIAIIKMSGGDAGLYVDAKANRNYYGAKGAGKKIGMYHFAGGQSAVNEADFFIAACSPLEEDDVLILDWELNKHENPVQWCHDFIQRVIDRTHTVPLLYMSSSRTTADRDAAGKTRYLDWSPVVNQNVGLWVANYGVSTDENVPLKWWDQYVMHQYTGTGNTAGVAGEVDKDVWFGTVDQFAKYGFHNPTNDQPEHESVPDAVTAVPAPVDNSVPASEAEQHGSTPDPNLDDLDYDHLDMDEDPKPKDPSPVPVEVTNPTPVVVETPQPQVIHVQNLKASILTAITAIMAAAAALLAYLRT